MLYQFFFLNTVTLNNWNTHEELEPVRVIRNNYKEHLTEGAEKSIRFIEVLNYGESNGIKDFMKISEWNFVF